MLVSVQVLLASASCLLYSHQFSDLSHVNKDLTVSTIPRNPQYFFLLGLTDKEQAFRCAMLPFAISAFETKVLPKLMEVDSDFRLMLKEVEMRKTLLEKVGAFYQSLMELDIEILDLHSTTSPLVSPLIPRTDFEGFKSFNEANWEEEFYDLRQYFYMAFTICTKPNVYEYLAAKSGGGSDSGSAIETYQADHKAEIREEMESDYVPNVIDFSSSTQANVEKTKDTLDATAQEMMKSDEALHNIMEETASQSFNVEIEDEEVADELGSGMSRVVDQMKRIINSRKSGRVQSLKAMDAYATNAKLDTQSKQTAKKKKLELTLEDLKSSSARYKEITAMDMETRGALIYISVYDWAFKFSSFMSCGNMAYLSTQKMTVLLHKLFFYFIIDPEYMHEFFSALFKPLQTTSFLITDPLVSFILLHGKMFGCFDEWYSLLNELHEIKATISIEAFHDPQTEEDYEKANTISGQTEGLAIQFAARYRAFIEASWRFASGKVKSNLLETNEFATGFSIGKLIFTFAYNTLELLLKTYMEFKIKMFIKATTKTMKTAKKIFDGSKKITKWVLRIAKANNIAFVKNACEYIKKWKAKAEKELQRRGQQAVDKILDFVDDTLNQLAGVTEPPHHKDKKRVEFAPANLEKLFKSDVFDTFKEGPEDWKSSQNDVYVEILAKSGLYENLGEKKSTKHRLI